MPSKVGLLSQGGATSGSRSTRSGLRNKSDAPKLLGLIQLAALPRQYKRDGNSREHPGYVI